MRCPFCGSLEDRVVDSRPTDDGDTIRRRRECAKCAKRYTTYEKVEILPLVVIKKDNSRENFNREKLMRGISRACEKRPVAADEMHRIVDDIETQLSNSLEREVASKSIGELLMEKLKKLDQVAYVRFASVYRDFSDIDTFLDEIHKIRIESTPESQLDLYIVQDEEFIQPLPQQRPNVQTSQEGQAGPRTDYHQEGQAGPRTDYHQGARSDHQTGSRHGARIGARQDTRAVSMPVPLQGVPNASHQEAQPVPRQEATLTSHQEAQPVPRQEATLTSHQKAQTVPYQSTGTELQPDPHQNARAGARTGYHVRRRNKSAQPVVHPHHRKKS